MERISGAVSWYQQKIGAYDKQLWEKSVEERVLKSIAQVPKKNARVKPELIDVDLVRGSTFTKAKPQHGWLAVSRQGLLRLLLLPIFFSWWERQTTRWFTVTICLLYILQVTTTVAYVTDSGEAINNETLSSAHIIVPWVLMIVLGLMHSQIVATRLSHKHHHRPKNKRRGKSRKRKTRCSFKKTASCRESGSQETGGDTHFDEESSGSRERRVTSNKTVELLKSRLGNHKHCLTDTLFPKFQQNGTSKEGSEVSDDHNCEDNGVESDSVVGDEAVGHCKVRQEKGVAKNRLFTEISAPYNGGCTVCQTNKSQQINSQHREKLSLDGLQNMLANKIDGLKNTVSNHSRLESDDERVCNSRDLAGELILPAQDIEGVSLTDDLIIPCNVGNMKPASAAVDEHSPNNVSQRKPGVSPTVQYLQTNRKAWPSRTLQSGAEKDAPVEGESSDEIGARSSQGRISIVNPSLMDSVKQSKKYTSTSDVVQEGVLPPGGEHFPEGCRHRHLGSKSTACLDGTSDGPVGRHQGPSSVGHVMNNVPRTGINDDSDGEGRQTPPTMLLRRRRWESSQECPLEGTRIKEVQWEQRATGRLSVKVVDRKESTGLSSCESEADTTPNTPMSQRGTDLVGTEGANEKIQPQPTLVTLTEDTDASSDGQTSELEWEDTMHSAVTSSDSSSCSSEMDSSDRDANSEDPFRTSHLHSSSSVLNNLASSSDKVSCMIWEGEQLKKVDLTVLDIGWTIIQKVDKIPQMCDYVVLGVLFALVFMMMPVMFRTYHAHLVWPAQLNTISHFLTLGEALFGTHWRIQVVVVNGAIQRFFLALIFFFLLSVADRTFKQRLLYAKNFCYLTSSRRARKYDLPHFRLNKVRNIKTWLSLRSYLKKRGPQRSVDTIVSASFLLAVTLVSLMCLKLLQDSGGFLDHLGSWELVLWCMALAIYLLRFMTIGTKINRKYRNFSVLITEQINLYLHMEQKPRKKDELMLANNVLKLAEDLLKELESPFKISGLSANPFLYNITKVIVLSAFSAVLTELLGFKLKLYKIKLRP